MVSKSKAEIIDRFGKLLLEGFEPLHQFDRFLTRKITTIGIFVRPDAVAQKTRECLLSMGLNPTEIGYSQNKVS